MLNYALNEGLRCAPLSLGYSLYSISTATQESYSEIYLQSLSACFALGLAVGLAKWTFCKKRDSNDGLLVSIGKIICYTTLIFLPWIDNFRSYEINQEKCFGMLDSYACILDQYKGYQEKCLGQLHRYNGYLEECLGQVKSCLVYLDDQNGVKNFSNSLIIHDLQIANVTI